MFGKVEFYFLLTLYTAQVYTTEPELRDINSAMEEIKKLIDDLKKMLENITVNGQATIKKIKVEIEQIARRVDLDIIINDSQLKIEEIIITSGVDANIANVCRRQALQNLMKIVSETSAAILKCKNEANIKCQYFKTDIEKLENKTIELKNTIIRATHNCWESNEANSNELLRCLEYTHQKYAETVTLLSYQIKQTIDFMPNVILDVSKTLEPCIELVNENVNTEQNIMFDHLEQCLANLE